jgi:hypothetical protein
MNRCASCDIEVTLPGFSTPEGAYCCAGCSEGGPCCCSYSDLPHAGSGNGHADPIVTLALLGEPGSGFTGRDTQSTA